ncbi:S1 domain-containing protein [Actinokineospora pegani]|uniref:hypothetical protein n=1 Tax=Actinokineospora pegani TaxID=2654637 RepID=UPI0012EA8D59|nr:hypothetical protein [Actinokineospora pegani]
MGDMVHDRVPDDGWQEAVDPIDCTVTAVFPFGVYVDVTSGGKGFIDAVYVGDDHYEVGQLVCGHLVHFDEDKGHHRVRPHGKVPMHEYLRRVEQVRQDDAARSRGAEPDGRA